MVLRGCFFILILFLNASCSKDEAATQDEEVDTEVLDDGSNNIPDGVNITRVKDTLIYYDNISNYTFSDYFISGNKIISKTKTVFSVLFGQQSTPVITNYNYVYNNGNLISSDGDIYNETHYDSMGRLEWADVDTLNFNRHYHYLYPANNVVHCEMLDASYGSASANVVMNIYMTFSSYGNLITVETDSANFPKVNFVLRNGNVTKIKYFYTPPEVHEITYTTAIDTRNIIKVNTYGRKNYLLINAFSVATGDIRYLLTRNYKDTDPGPQHVDFQVNEANFIKRMKASFLVNGSTHIYSTLDYTLE
jgi:hypothetical protein